IMNSRTVKGRRSDPAQVPSPAAGVNSTAAADVEGSRWTPRSRTHKEVEGGQCGSGAQGTKKVASGQCGPDPQWPSVARVGALCPPGDLAGEGQPSVTKRSETGDHREGMNERPGPGPFSATPQGADHENQASRTVAGATHRHDAWLAARGTNLNRAGRGY